MYWSGFIFEFDNFVFHVLVFVIFIFISKYKITVSETISVRRSLRCIITPQHI